MATKPVAWEISDGIAEAVSASSAVLTARAPHTAAIAHGAQSSTARCFHEPALSVSGATTRQSIAYAGGRQLRCASRLRSMSPRSRA